MHCTTQAKGLSPGPVGRFSASSCAVLAATFATFAVVVAPSSAEAAPQLIADKPCYLTLHPMKITGTGFGADAPIEIVRPNLPVLGGGKAGPSGGFVATLKAPAAAAVGLSGVTSVEYPITARDPSSGTEVTINVRLTALAFKNSGGFISAKKKRTWTFIGFLARPGKPIYGHFRFKGRTRADYRFGSPTGACGGLTVRAPGIPVPAADKGKWTLQLDQNRTYKAKEPYKVRVTIPVG